MKDFNILELKRIENDANGNPRWYMELDAPARDEDADKLHKLGWKSWRNGYGFKWWCQSYLSEKQLIEELNDTLN